ncbi:hypothetical protein [Flavisolibacter ginsenosidimutans]|uniref:Uncharacterized protein n=1 Tax=Flavisolibacter ginsenosidimutans TaxID=661481 RepID=A0A5B8UK56_9BACT|nr:hypothetical protein [Flavisolibacter ginsenosidimutans]QEC56816.1 hypothetical protein FSB75_13215 [Flavisolibacter ginsenosidimutans]
MSTQFLTVRGCITQEKYIKGRTLSELESILGFHTGHLAQGATITALLQVPTKSQFNLLGYTQVAEHKISKEAFNGLDTDKLKDLLLRETFTTVGINRLVKVIAKIAHSKDTTDEQYPPGWGVPQWKLTAEMPAQVIAELNSGERYI